MTNMCLKMEGGFLCAGPVFPRKSIEILAFSRYNKGMIIYRLTALVFLVTTPLASQLLVSLLRFKAPQLHPTDITWPLYALELVLVSRTLLVNSLLPHYLVAMSILSIVLCIWLLRKPLPFSYRRFGKLYWRWAFFVTLCCYVAMLVLIHL